MEKFVFKTVMDRLINDRVKIDIFASDRHVGIRKELRENYSQIIQLYNIFFSHVVRFLLFYYFFILIFFFTF